MKLGTVCIPRDSFWVILPVDYCGGILSLWYLQTFLTILK